MVLVKLLIINNFIVKRLGIIPDKGQEIFFFRGLPVLLITNKVYLLNNDCRGDLNCPYNYSRETFLLLKPL